MAETGRFGKAFDESEFLSPMDVGPSQGQEGWTPANPVTPEPTDPLGYLKPISGRQERD
jgi:hypothetical protein